MNPRLPTHLLRHVFLPRPGAADPASGMAAARPGWCEQGRWLAGAFLLALIGLALLPIGQTFADAAWPLGEPGLGATPSAAECAPGNRVAYGHALIIPAADWICGDADAYGGAVQVLGRVSGNVVALGGSITIGGEVDGNVTAFGGGVALLPGARVAGDVQVWGGRVAHAPGATVAGNIESGDRMRDFAGGVWPSFQTSWHFPTFWMLGWALLAALVATLLPERTARVRQVARAALGRSLLVGLLTALLGLGLAGLLFATCIGIPFSLLLAIGLLGAWVLGTVAISLGVGERLLGVIAPGRASPLMAAVVGAVVLTLAESVPCVGGALTIVASSIGLGATLLSRFGGRMASPAIGLATPPTVR